MTLDFIPHREYIYSVAEGVTTILHVSALPGNNCAHHIVGDAHNHEQAEELIRAHEKRWHQAKVIQMNAPHTGRTGPQRMYPL